MEEGYSLSTSFGLQTFHDHQSDSAPESEVHTKKENVSRFAGLHLTGAREENESPEAYSVAKSWEDRPIALKRQEMPKVPSQPDELCTYI